MLPALERSDILVTEPEWTGGGEKEKEPDLAGEKSGRRNRRRRRRGGLDEEATVPMARALGASEIEVRRLMSDGQVKAAEEKDRLVNPKVDPVTTAATPPRP